MIVIEDPKDCCGCTACASVCAHHAIQMEPDALGFLYPKINVLKCVNCGLCESVCSFNPNYDKSNNLPVPDAYGARHKDIKEVLKSRSGGTFVVISDYVLELGGVVYGAGWGDHFKVEHKRATTRVERDEFRGSKYVQSDLKDTFHQVKKDLKEGRLVVFSGTPCQTAGLNSYIGERLRNKLILIDIVCHGTPSPFIWRDYLDHIERKFNSTIQKVDFREKSENGWRDHKEAFILNENTKKWEYDFVKRNSRWKTWYTILFYQHITFRHSCGVCPFCNLHRPSDITLADFWGWEKQDTAINADNKGLNLVLVNTPKGKDIFSKVKENLTLIKAEPNAYMQPNLKHPSIIHPKRMKFENDYIKKGFEYIYGHDYNRRSLFYQFVLVIKKVVKRLL